MAETKNARGAGTIYSVDVSKVQLGRQPVIIESHGEPIAAVVPFDEYRRFSAWREERAARRVWVLERDPRLGMSAGEWHARFEAMDRFASQLDDVTGEELDSEIAEAIAAVRTDERAADVNSQ